MSSNAKGVAGGIVAAAALGAAAWSFYQSNIATQPEPEPIDLQVRLLLLWVGPNLLGLGALGPAVLCLRVPK
jgi:hypothetical protein